MIRIADCVRHIFRRQLPWGHGRPELHKSIKKKWNENCVICNLKCGQMNCTYLFNNFFHRYRNLSEDNGKIFLISFLFILIVNCFLINIIHLCAYF